MIRVLVVDDSPTARMLIVKTLESDAGIRVVGTAEDGNEAVHFAKTLRPDLITMDVRMPNLNGLMATEQIMAGSPTPILIVSSSVDAPDLQITFRALQAGALDVIEKPKALTPEGFEAMRDRLVDRVKAMAEIRVVGRRAPSGGFPVAAPTSRRYHLVAIGASTGGPQLLEQIFRGLPDKYPAPILLVQHMTPGFTAGFARWLRQDCGVQVKLAEEGEALLPGHVYVAPDGHHLRLGKNWKVELGLEPNGLFRPAIDVLFESAANVAGAAAVGLLLTGMGSDGTKGLLAMRAAGGLTLAQDAGSCVVAGMPDSARAAGAVERTVEPEAIPALLTSIVEPLSAAR